MSNFRYHIDDRDMGETCGTVDVTDAAFNTGATYRVNGMDITFMSGRRSKGKLEAVRRWLQQRRSNKK